MHSINYDDETRFRRRLMRGMHAHFEGNVIQKLVNRQARWKLGGRGILNSVNLYAHFAPTP